MHPVAVKWDLPQCGFGLHVLLANDTKVLFVHLFLSLLVLCISLENCLFCSFGHLKIGLFSHMLHEQVAYVVLSSWPSDKLCKELSHYIDEPFIFLMQRLNL